MCGAGGHDLTASKIGPCRSANRLSACSSALHASLGVSPPRSLRLDPRQLHAALAKELTNRHHRVRRPRILVAHGSDGNLEASKYLVHLEVLRSRGVFAFTSTSEQGRVHPVALHVVSDTSVAIVQSTRPRRRLKKLERAHAGPKSSGSATLHMRTAYLRQNGRADVAKNRKLWATRGVHRRGGRAAGRRRAQLQRRHADQRRR